MLTTTTTMGLRAITAAPSCTTRTILRNPYSTFSLRSAVVTTTTASSPSNNSSSPLTHTSSSSPSKATAASATTTTPLPSTIRAESTMATPPPPPNQPPPTEQPLDWQTFFALRKSRRRYQVFFSAFSALGTAFAGAVFLNSPSGEAVQASLPLDPFLSLGLGTTGFLALGWLMGPVLGNATFYVRNRRWKAQMTRKEIELFARIKKNRVDPSASSASNPVPDFYGEKIQSISGYRQWLKDQRAFNKKRTTFV